MTKQNKHTVISMAFPHINVRAGPKAMPALCSKCSGPAGCSQPTSASATLPSCGVCGNRSNILCTCQHLDVSSFGWACRLATRPDILQVVPCKVAEKMHDMHVSVLASRQVRDGHKTINVFHVCTPVNIGWRLI